MQNLDTAQYLRLKGTPEGSFLQPYSSASGKDSTSSNDALGVLVCCMASSSGQFKTREAWKAAKELEEARKAGTAPPAVDDEGKIINPHIPEYISQAPWYLNQQGPSLKHQRNQKLRKRKYDALGAWLPRGQTQGPAATKYRKGACENCGALTHSKRDCVERPRRRGAKLTGRDIRPDEVIASVNLDFQGKRDRWNGYDDKAEYRSVHDRYSKIEAERKALKAEKLDSELRSGKKKPSSTDNDDSDDSQSEDEKEAAAAQQAGKGSKMSVRNLRIREDTAKYLYNLDLDSAYYDPKSRAMHADPNPDANPDDKDYAGDNFVRFTGDVRRLAQMELHTMRAVEQGRNLPHLQAEPSRAEVLFAEFENKKKNLEERRREQIVSKYGGEEYTKRSEALEGVDQTEAYVEYSSDGRAIKSSKQVIPVSRYAEDVLDKNHKSIWGSFYRDGKWGYACCHQTQRNSLCTGDAGKQAALEIEKEMEQRVKDANAKRNPKPLAEQWKEREKERRESAPPLQKQAEKERERQREVEEEMRKQETEEQRAGEHDREGVYNSGQKQMEQPREMSDAVMEAYRLRRRVNEDPMAKYLSNKKR